MLELRNVSASYGEITALRDLSLKIAAGETAALIGRNGAGKSTTLRAVAGVIRPRAGDVSWHGESLLSLPPERRVRLGIALVPEGRGIFPGLSVEENLRMGLFWQKPSSKVVRQRMDAVFADLPVLGVRRRQLAGSMSGGEQQMLAIGRALMGEPKLVLLDEPSLGLSPHMVDSVYDLLATIKGRGVSFILVEQYVALALALCDYAIGLKKGRVVMSGRAEEVAQQGLSEVYMGGTDLGQEAATIAVT